MIADNPVRERTYSEPEMLARLTDLALTMKVRLDRVPATIRTAAELSGLKDRVGTLGALAICYGDDRPGLRQLGDDLAEHHRLIVAELDNRPSS